MQNTGADLICINIIHHVYTLCVCARTCVYVCSVVSNSLQPYGPQPTRLLCPWDSTGKNTRVGCYDLLQGIFPTQGSNPCCLCLLLWQAGSLPLAPPGKPINLYSKYDNSLQNVTISGQRNDYIFICFLEMQKRN